MIYPWGEQITGVGKIKPLNIDGDCVLQITNITSKAPKNSRILIYEDNELIHVIKEAELYSANLRQLFVTGPCRLDAEVVKAEAAGEEPAGALLISIKGSQIFYSDLLELDDPDLATKLMSADSEEISSGY
jgi:hypothetical protein